MDVQFLWFFELGVKGDIVVPIYFTVRLENIDRKDNIAQTNDVFRIPHLFSSQTSLEQKGFS